MEPHSHPGESDSVHSRKQPRTYTNPNNTNWGVNWWTEHCPLKVPTNDSHRSKHEATTSMAIALEWNVIASNNIWASFTIKYDLIKLYGSYHHNLIFQRSLIFPFWQKKFKTRYNSNQKKNFTNFHYAMRVPYYFKCSKHPPNDQCTIYAYKMSIITQNMLISLKLS